MAIQNLLRNKVDETPTIYAYTLPDVPKYRGLLKVGYTSRPGTIRIKEQGHELYLGKAIVLRRSSMRPDGTYFMDKGVGGVHYYMRKNHIPNPFGEWFRCHVKDVERAIHAAMERRDSMTDRIYDFRMRPEQAKAVKATSDYLTAFKKDPANRGLVPHYLWNAKMRFGKTFTTYQLAREMGWDCIVLDEYHYGAWGKNAKNFYDKKDLALRRAEEMGETAPSFTCRALLSALSLPENS